MKKTYIIVWAILSLACVGLSIGYCCTKQYTQFAIYLVIGIGCLAWALFVYFRARKNEKKNDENNDKKDL